MTQNSPSILGNRLECRLVLPNVGEDGTLMGSLMGSCLAYPAAHFPKFLVAPRHQALLGRSHTHNEVEEVVVVERIAVLLHGYCYSFMVVGSLYPAFGQTALLAAC